MMREGEDWHQCCCLITHQHPAVEQGMTLKERCYAVVFGMDAPFCNACDSRHPEYQDKEGIEVTAVLSNHEEESNARASD